MAQPVDTTVESEKSKETKKEDNTVLQNVLTPIEEENLFRVDSEEEIIEASVFSRNGACNEEISLVPSFKVLPPHLPKHLIKGNSKSNVSKGKRPMVDLSYNVPGDLVPTETTTMKRIYELTEESLRYDKSERIRATLKERISDLHLRKLFSLEDVVKVFYSQAIPISLKLPVSLSTTSLATLLLIEENSDFLECIRGSLPVQDNIRRHLLEEKNLPVCRCGFIYVHPSLTYTNHSGNNSVVIGNLGNVVAVEEKKLVLTRLNALRFFLEILYEHLKLE